jgi:hypothetical protein
MILNIMITLFLIFGLAKKNNSPLGAKQSIDLDVDINTYTHIQIGSLLVFLDRQSRSGLGQSTPDRAKILALKLT